MNWPRPVFARAKQRRHDAVGGENAGGMIDERDTGDFGIVEVGDQAHHAAQRLADRVEAGLVAVGSALAVAGDRAVDQFGVELRQLFVVEAKLVSCRRAEVFQENIRGCQKLAQNLARLFCARRSSVTLFLLRLSARKLGP